MVTEQGSDNPYEAPETENEVVRRPKTRRGASSWWVSVVLLNLPIPVMFGISSTSGYGRIGMVIGVAITTVVGLFFCRKFPQLMTDLSKGALLTAFSQFYPILQMFVGLFALEACGGLAGTGASVVSGIIPVTTATLLTGAGLIAPSLIVGVTCCSLFRFIRSD